LILARALLEVQEADPRVLGCGVNPRCEGAELGELASAVVSQNVVLIGLGFLQRARVRH